MVGESGTRAAAAAALAIVAGSSAANAQQVVSIPVSQVLANGGTYDGTFDISSLLHNSSGDFRVTSATIELDGYSPFGQTGTAYAYSYTYTYSYSYDCGGWWSWDTCTGYATATVPVYAPVDQSADELILSDGSISTFATDSATGFYPQSYYGALVAQLVLGSPQIANANSTGSISFTGTAYTNSDVQLTEASLSLNLAALERNVSAVPEPSTWAMMMVGFGAMGLAVRRRGRRTARVAIA